MLKEDCGEVGVRNQIATERNAADLFVNLKEALPFAECAGLRKRQKTSDVR